MEKKAVDILSTTIANNNDDSERQALKLLAQSVILKYSDPFIKKILNHPLITNSHNASEFAEQMDILATDLKAIGLPSHVIAAVHNKNFQSYSTKSSQEDEKVDLGSNFSDTVCDGVRVKVTSFYDSKRSDPQNGKFIFWYKAAIFNEGNDPIQVLSGTWEIAKLDGEKEVFRGNGVKNLQPIIPPGESFAYQSMCPLRLAPPIGKHTVATLSGFYTVCKGSMGQETFHAKIGPVNLILPNLNPPFFCEGPAINTDE